MKVKINECQKKRNEAHKLWLDLEKKFSSTSVGAADESDLNKMRNYFCTELHKTNTRDIRMHTFISIHSIDIIQKFH